MIWYYVLAVYLLGVVYGLGRYLYDVIQYKRKPYLFCKFTPTSLFHFKLSMFLSFFWPIFTIAVLVVRMTR